MKTGKVLMNVGLVFMVIGAFTGSMSVWNYPVFMFLFVGIFYAGYRIHKKSPESTIPPLPGVRRKKFWALSGSAAGACLASIYLTASANPQMKLSVIVLFAVTALSMVVGAFYFALVGRKG